MIEDCWKPWLYLATLGGAKTVMCGGLSGITAWRHFPFASLDLFLLLGPTAGRGTTGEKAVTEPDQQGGVCRHTIPTWHFTYAENFYSPRNIHDNAKEAGPPPTFNRACSVPLRPSARPPLRMCSGRGGVPSSLWRHLSQFVLSISTFLPLKCIWNLDCELTLQSLCLLFKVSNQNAGGGGGGREHRSKSSVSG